MRGEKEGREREGPGAEEGDAERGGSGCGRGEEGAEERGLEVGEGDVVFVVGELVEEGLGAGGIWEVSGVSWID